MHQAHQMKQSLPEHLPKLFILSWWVASSIPCRREDEHVCPFRCHLLDACPCFPPTSVAVVCAIHDHEADDEGKHLCNGVIISTGHRQSRSHVLDACLTMLPTAECGLRFVCNPQPGHLGSDFCNRKTSHRMQRLPKSLEEMCRTTLEFYQE